MANPAGFALDSGQGAHVAGVRPYPARESVRGRSNLKTLHWTVFPRQGAGRFIPHARLFAPLLTCDLSGLAVGVV
ncbi:MAG: hypothetical protein FJX28_10270 [Alphaproteobacteria bacterium]|nr:hypothetical protein [Alphaproteobacteria bacterium]